MPKPPSFSSYMIAAVLWVLLAHIPIMTLVGNDWLFETFPRNVASLFGLYAIFIPYVVSGACYLIVKRRFDRRHKETSHA